MASSQHNKPYNPSKKGTSPTQGTQHTQAQASNFVQSPMLRRWLDEGKTKDVGQLGDRDGYAKGKAGMTEYIADWDRAWQHMERKADGSKRA